MKIRTPSALILAALALGACSSENAGTILARAGRHELSVDHATRLLAGATQVPNQPDVVEAVAELWRDYTVLATAMAEDSTLAQLDLGDLVTQQVEQEMVVALRDSVVQTDTILTEEELRGLFDSEVPGERVRASHILRQFPDAATQAQKDSVRATMEDILDRVRGGEDFGAVAQEMSQDPGSAPQGGDLGFFERGAMVLPFEEAAFALEPGEVSGIVESPFGLHIIKLEEKETPTFEDMHDSFRAQVQSERFQKAESTYIASVEEGAGIEVQEGAADLVRELAADPDMDLSRRAGNRALVRYDGGEFTVAELATFLQTRNPQFLQGLTTGGDDDIENIFLRGLTQRELLLREALAAGLEPAQAQRDSLAGVYRTSFVEVAHTLGLADIEPRGTESLDQAIERTVEEKLQAIIAGTEQVIPLGALSFASRDRYPTRTFQAGVQATVDQVAAMRGPATPAAPPASSEAPPPPPPPDTSGG